MQHGRDVHHRVLGRPWDSGEFGPAPRLTTKTAYDVDGISPKVAIAIGDVPKTATFFAVNSGSEPPPEVQKLIHGS
ncbi:DUF6281 family protein [Streptomyces sp. NPDC005780]|uniref:DUF6281 family protein n=1 Tax=Streptomyces sp. NPDC005780 TaxID=3364730 RepID=UPI0036960A46